MNICYKFKNTIFNHSEFKLCYTYDSTNKTWYLNISIWGKYYKLSNLIRSQNFLDFLLDEDED
jgi:hypothetical protein